MSGSTRYALLLASSLANGCLLRADVDTPDDEARCDTAVDAAAYCAEQFGAGYACVPSDGASYCVQAGCVLNIDCAHLTTGCLLGVCDQGVCQIEPAADGTTCDDGSYCNGAETCAGGACVAGAAPCAQCTTCNEANDRCDPLDAGACDDGFYCTETDACENGVCRGTPNDTLCGVNQRCVPDCFAGPSGCGTPPQMTVTCDPPGGAATDAVCDIQLLDGQEGQAACLACRAYVGFVLLDNGDFQESDAACVPDGWDVLSGTGCSAIATCASVGATGAACCDDFASFCDDGFRGRILDSVREENCGGGFEQWRLTRSFDTTGLSDLRFCFDVSEAYGDANDSVMAWIEDPTSSEVARLCLPGDTDWRAGFQTLCADLPPETWNSSARVTLLAHVDSASPSYPSETRRMSLRAPTLHGRDARCAELALPVFSEDFTGCALSDWEVDHVQCGAGVCDGHGDGVWVENDVGSLTRFVDLSDASGDIELCFSAGNVASPDQDDRIGIEVMTDPVDGWRFVGWGSLYRAADNQCQQICVSLSAMHPALAHHPNAGIRVSLESAAAGRRVLIDDLTLTAAAGCSAEQYVATGTVAEVGSGTYEVMVRALGSGPMVTEVTCEWTGVAGPSATTAVTLLE